ncbi:MAG: hypothetical protein ABI142_07660 [Bryocella sp.]
MIKLRPTLLTAFTVAALVGLGFSGTAMAASEGAMAKPNTMMMTGPDGRMMSVEMNQQMMDNAAIKAAKPMPGTQMMFMKNGKMYVIKDSKMPDGKMWSEHMGMTR